MDNAPRVDIRWGDCWPGTVREQAREKKRKGVCRRVAPQNTGPETGENFLDSQRTRRNFFLSIALKWSLQTEKQVISMLL